MSGLRYRGLGVCFLALMIAGVWLTYAVFTKQFTAYDEVTLHTTRLGLQLPDRADVKIRGVLIGEVLDTRATAEGATLTLGIKPDEIDRVPATVTGAILPKTLFGEKYVSLEIPADQAGASPSASNAASHDGSRALRAGAVIGTTKVATELEAVLTDLYPLLRAVSPADLNTTLNAVSTALEGRGAELGSTLATADAYLRKINPQVPLLIADLRATAKVSRTYAAILPQVASILRDSLVTTGTLKEQQEPVRELLTNVTGLANTSREFLEANEANLTSLARINDGLLETAARYAPEFPCLLGGIDALGRREAVVFRNYTLHIVLKTLAKQPRAYTAADKPVLREDRGPGCGHLPNPNWSQANPLRVVPQIDDGVQGAVR